MLDSFGRNINYLRISVTDLCNLRCKYCMPEKGIAKACHDEILTFEEIQHITEKFAELGVNKVRITGGEPLVRRDILNLIERISTIKGIDEIAMTTNGILLKEYAKALKEAGLSRVNISLDTLNPDKYRDITKGGELKAVLEGIAEAKKVGLTPIKINVVLMKGFNEDEIKDFVDLTIDEEIDVRFIELMPIGQVKNWSLNKYLSNETVLNKVPELVEIEAKDSSSPAKYYKFPKGKGNVGLINPISCKFCSNCNRVRLTADGKIKPCLHSDEEIDIKALVRNGQDITKVLCDIVKNKPKEHDLEDGKYIEREMTAIGG
ncbi:GTP 3',8-cyclase MoaA [Clostridium manihotivorum]|uniref:GTP 3',8-cyclase n=1 Tax=Clostridium manihotivorum TaxID=2320868 RepID=A0A410E225_9CLOT|nr:GTP 3',8-cyclase MoaA [Clostridium manihotivorum]QAA35333.1 GTP 3',8-cyclase MoaA [Clostridium manihotivorum]